MGGKLQRSTVEAAFAHIAAAERPLQQRLLASLASRKDVQVQILWGSERQYGWSALLSIFHVRTELMMLPV